MGGKIYRKLPWEIKWPLTGGNQSLEVTINGGSTVLLIC